MASGLKRGSDVSKNVVRAKESSSETIELTSSSPPPPPTTKSAHTSRINTEHYLLLATTYGLNNSYSKKIVVGFRALNDGRLCPCVKIIGSSMLGVCFDSISWTQFQEGMEEIEEYLSSGRVTGAIPVIMKDVSVLFSTAYGSRAIVLAQMSTATNSRSDEEKTDEPAKEKILLYQQEQQRLRSWPMSPPLAKKQKTYSPDIVMQKTTFDGLKFILGCVNEGLLQLMRISKKINKYLELLKSEIEMNLPNAYLDEDLIKQVLHGHYSNIKESVKSDIGSGDAFIDEFFNIIFYEMTTIHLDEITRLILLKHSQ